MTIRACSYENKGVPRLEAKHAVFDDAPKVPLLKGTPYGLL